MTHYKWLIYSARFPDGKYYIGQTMKTLEHRKKGHYSAGLKNNTTLFDRILHEYSPEDVVWEIVEDNISSKKRADELEIYYIDFYNSYIGFENSRGYNCTLGGDDNPMIDPAPEVWEKHSQSIQEVWSDPEFRKMMSEKMREQNKEFWSDPEYRKMMSEKMREQVKEFWSDPEYRKIQSEKMQERWSDSEFRKMMSEMRSDPEFRKMMSEKMREQNKEFWSDPEYRKMQSEKMQERWSDPEYRKMQSEKMREQVKEFWSDPEFRKNLIERNRKKVEKSIIKVIVVNNLMECGLNLTHSLKIAQISDSSFYKYRKYISPE